MDKIERILAAAETVLARSARILIPIEYWSTPQLDVTIPAVAANVALPNVVVAGLPSGITVVLATLVLRYRYTVDTGGAVAKLNGAQHIQIQKGGAGGYADAISLIDDQFNTSNLTGLRDVNADVMGDHNVSAKVTGNDTYNCQWTSALSDVANLVLKEVQMGLKIWYSI